MPSDLNAVAVNGRIEGFKVTSDCKYPWAWVKLGIGTVPFVDTEGETQLIKAGSLFLNFNVPEKKLKNTELFEKGLWLSAWECILDHYKKDRDAKTQYKLRASVTKFMVSEESMMPVNNVVIAGRVSDRSKNGHWYRFAMSYLNTFAKDGQEKWPTRFCKIYSPYLDLSVGSRYLVTGHVAGSDPQGNEGLLVVASTVSKGRF